MLQVTFDTYADGNAYRRDSIFVNDRREIGGIDDFNGFSGTLIVEISKVQKCTYCGQWEKVEIDRCGSCGQHM